MEINVKGTIYSYDSHEIWEHIHYDPDMIDTLLGYGTVYRIVYFGDISLQDGTRDDILEQVNNLDDEKIFQIMRDL